MKFTIALVSLVMFLFVGVSASPQSVGQIGFVMKNAMPAVETIAVVVSQNSKEQAESEARSAVVITKKKYMVYPVTTKADIAKQVQSILSLGSVAVLVLTDEAVLNADSVKFIAQKIGLKKIPLVSNRAGDTAAGAVMAVIKAGEKIEKHVNKKLLPVFDLTLSPEFLSDCVIDQE